MRSALPQRIVVMHARHGRAAKGVCGECRHLLRVGYTRTYFKCELFGKSSSQASDWRKRWPACGQFELKGKDTPAL